MEITNPDPQDFNLISLRSLSVHVMTDIQSHGVLLVLQEPDLKILQVSNNTIGAFEVAPSRVIGQSLATFLDVFQVEQFRAALADRSFDHSNYTKVWVTKYKDKYRIFDAVFHRSPDGYLILELEPTQKDEHIPFQSFYHLAKASIMQGRGVANSQLTATADLPAFGRIMVAEVRKLTGFDRVLLYKFDVDGHGEVIDEDSEKCGLGVSPVLSHTNGREPPVRCAASGAPFQEKVAAMDSYLGLHFPESDIPRPAREMFLSNRIRVVSDVRDESVQLIPALNPLTEQLTDLSRSMLRSPDPCHAEYLQNMGVSASLTISLIKDGRLWGIITCHHQTAKFVSYELRNACELLAQVIFDRISIIEDIVDYGYRSKLAHIRSMGIERMSQSATGSPESTASFIDALMGQSPNLLDLFDAGGAAICVGSRWTTIGQTPPLMVLDDLVQWLTENVRDDVFTTDSLPLLANDPVGGARFKDVASGMLAISLSPDSHVLCFRPEVIQTVNWGGNPEHAHQEEVAADGNMRLSPRKSFQLWQEQVRLHSLPWQAVDIATAVELRKLLVNIILRQSEVALRQSEARYRTLVTSAPVGIFQTDIAGDCLFINQQGLELMGASQAEVLGRGWANSIHPDDLPRVSAAWESTVVVNHRFGLEYRMMTPQGQVNWVYGNAVAIEDEAGNITGYLGTLTDITEKKRLEQQFSYLR